MPKENMLRGILMDIMCEGCIVEHKIPCNLKCAEEIEERAEKKCTEIKQLFVERLVKGKGKLEAEKGNRRTVFSCGIEKSIDIINKTE